MWKKSLVYNAKGNIIKANIYMGCGRKIEAQPNTKGRKNPSIFRALCFGILFIFAFLFFAIFANPSRGLAAFNEQINYQGKLFSSTSAAVLDGAYNFTFRLYTASSGGSPIWTEECTTTNRIDVRNGLFSHMLGSVYALPDNIFNQDLYLTIDVGGTTTVPVWDGEMNPRKHLGAVGAAFEAKRLGGKLESQLATLAENETITGAWTHQNSLTISSSTSATLLTITQSGVGNAAEILGKMAVGTTTATAQLTVQGTSTNALFSVLTSGGNISLFSSSSGYVGINTSTPAYNLDVAGDINFSGALRVAGANLSQFFIDTAGTAGNLWSSDGSGKGAWLATTSLGIDVNHLIGSTTLAYLSADNNFLGNNTFLGVSTSYLTSSGIYSGDIYTTGFITLGGVARNTWPSAGGGGSTLGWITSTIANLLHPALDPPYAVVINAGVTTSQVVFEVAGNSKLGGTVEVTGKSTLANVSSTNLTVSGATVLAGISTFASTTINGTTTMANATATNLGITSNFNVAGQTNLANASGTALTLSGDQWVGGALYVTGQTSLGNVSSTNLTISTNSYLGTVRSGTWNGSIIGATYLGGGTPSANTLLFGDGQWRATSTLGLSYSDLRDSSNLVLLNANNIFTGANTFASTTINGTTTMANATATNLGITSNFNVAGQTSLGNVSSTNLTISGALTWGTNDGLLEAISGAIRATSTANFLTTGNASALYVPYTYASSVFPAFSYVSSTFPNFAYASSVFATYAYNTSTFVTYSYGSSTYATTNHTHSQLHDPVTENILGIDLTGQALTLTSGYFIPTTSPAFASVTTTNLWASNVSSTNISSTNLTVSNNTILANATATNFGVTSDFNVAGQTSLGNVSSTNLTISTNSYLGTVRSGTWNGSIIGATYLGGGTPSANTLLFGDGQWRATSTLGLSYSDLRDNSNLALLNANNIFTGANTFASTTINGTTTMANATATNLGITSNFNVAGQTNVGNVSSTNLTISSALTWGTNSGLLEAVSGAVRATSTANFLTTGNASALYVPYTYASSVFPTFAYASSSFVNFTYASTVFATFAYNSSTFSTYSYNSSTFPTFAYASSTFVTYSYGSSTYATASHTHAQLHDAVTENILGIDLTGQALTLTSGYFIPTTSPAFASVTTTNLYPTNIIGATNVSTTHLTASGNTILGNATATNLGITSNFNVAGQTNVGNISSTNLTISSALTWGTNSGLLEAVSGAVRATSTANFLTTGNASALYVPYTYASSVFPTFTYVSSSFVNFTYASTVFATFAYNSSTFSTYSYNSSTFPAFTYASSTFVTYSYGSSTYATTNHTHSQLHDPITENILGIDLTGQALSLTSGYFIPTTSPAFASVTTTNLWATNVSTTHLTASGNTVLGNATATNFGVTSNFNVAGQANFTTASGTAITLTGDEWIGGALYVTGQTSLGSASSTNLTISTNSYLGTVKSGTWNGSAIDISSYTNLTAGSGIVLTGDALSHDTANGYIHIPANGASTQLLQYSSAGTAKWITMSGDASIADNGAVVVADDSHAHTGATISGSLVLTGVSSTYATATWALIANASTTNLTVSNNSYLGTVKSGTWNGSIIGAAYLGGGTPSANTLLFGDGQWRATSTLGLSYLDLRDNSNLALLNANNVFTGQNTFSATSTLATSSITRLSLSGSFLDASNAVGSLGMLLQSTGTSTKWVATSALGLGGAASAAGATGQIQFNNSNAFSATSVLYWDNSVGSLSIGTSTTRYGQLFVGARNPTLSLSRAVGSQIADLSVQNNYLYALNSGLVIIDISNPASTTIVTSSSIVSGSDINVQGRYAYVGDNNSFHIVDISDPLRPFKISSNSIWGSGSNTRLALDGKYLYSINGSYANFVVYDISDINNIRQIYSSNNDLSSPAAIAVSGNKLFIADWNALHIYDISDPHNPIAISSFSVATNGGTAFKVQGKYVYLITGGGLGIWDFATTTPYLVGQCSPGGFSWDLEVQGRYAYINSNIGVLVYDISNPANIIESGSMPLTNAYGIKVQGRYAFVGDGTNLKTIDLGGAFLQQVEAGSILTGGLDVAGDANFGGFLFVKDALSVGSGGVFSQGPMSVYTSTTLSTSSIFSVSSLGTGSALVVTGSGFVGLGTSTPQTKLTVLGTTTAWNVLPDMAGSSGNVSLYNLGASTTRWNSIWVSSTYIGSGTWQISQGGSGQLSIFSSPGSNERLTISSNGYVGVGSTTPAYNFSVSGTIGVTGAYYDAYSTSGSLGMVLQTTGTSTRWVATSTLGIGGGSGTPAGVDGSVQYKSGTDFAGNSLLFWDATNKRLGVGTSTPTSSLEVYTSTTNSVLSITADNMAGGSYSPIVNFNAGRAPMTFFRLMFDNVDGLGKILAPVSGIESITVNSVFGTVGIGGDADATNNNILSIYGNTSSSGSISAAALAAGAGGVVSAGNIQIINPGARFIGACNLVAGSCVDFAEIYSADMPVESGDVVALNPGNSHITKASAPYQQNIIGVVSTNPGVILGEAGGVSMAGTYVLDPLNPAIALMGRVPVKVSDENGAIHKGDYLTSAPTPGYAMKATRAGKVIGMALEDFDFSAQSTSTGRVMVFMGVSWMGNDLSVQLNENSQPVVNPIVSPLRNQLSDIGIAISEEGLLEVKTLKAKKVITNEFETVDKATGQTYCIWIENGEWKKVLGSCQDIVNQQPVGAGDIFIQPAPADNSSNSTSVVATPEIVGASSSSEVAPPPIISEAPAPFIPEIAAPSSPESLPPSEPAPASVPVVEVAPAAVQ